MSLWKYLQSFYKFKAALGPLSKLALSTHFLKFEYEQFLSLVYFTGQCYFQKLVNNSSYCFVNFFIDAI